VTSGPSIFIFSREYPPASVGGTSTVARNLAVGLVAEGWNVTVITSVSRSPGAEREWNDGVLVLRSGTDIIYDASSGLAGHGIRAHRRLYMAARLIATELGPPTVVALPDLFCYPEAAMFARHHAVPLVNILLQDFRAITPYDRGAHHVTTGVSADRQHLLDIERKAVCESDHTVYISRALSDAVTGYYPVGQAPHSVIHLGVDHSEIAAVETDRQWRRKRHELLGADPARPLLVACGRLVPVKGFAILLQALDMLGSVVCNDAGMVLRPHLALLGVGPEEAPLRQLAADRGLASRVTFLGDLPRREVLGWMSVADVAVVPSLWESFCYVCAEMMAFGRPVVATAVDSLRELIPSVQYGYPVPVSGPLARRALDPGDLAFALREAFTHPHEARRRGAAARSRIAGQFDNARFAQRISALCHDVTAANAHA
jgi:glycogen(starch) synthase